MQQAIVRRGVYRPSMSAVIGGRTVDVEAVDVDRELPDPVQSGQLTAASGTLSVVDGPDTESVVATPWDPGSSWPPVPETSASASMDTGSGPVSLLSNGRVISASGGTGGRSVQVEVADQYQSLDRSISWDAVAAAVPSIEDRGTSRYVSMLTTSIVDMILRECGWYATPPRLGFIGLSVPAMGTMWPERGTVLASGRESDVNFGGYPSWPTTTWGMGVADVRADYEMGGNYSLTDRGCIELTAMTNTPPSGQFNQLYTINEAGNGLVRMLWSDSQGILQVRGNDGTWTDVVRIAHTRGFLYASVERVSGGTVLGTIRSGSNSASATLSGVSTWVTGHVHRRVRVIVQPGAGGSGGFQVAFPNSIGGLANWSPNAVQYVRTSQRNNLLVRRAVAGENCAEFLQRLCEAEAATYWIDETGVLRWWDLTRLEARDSVATLTSDEDIAESGFTWEHGVSSRHSRVAVNWSDPLRQWSWTTTVDMWQGSGSTVQGGTDEEQWINVPDDEEWLMVDTAISRAPGTVGGSVRDYNYGWGSWYGARADRGDGLDTWVQLAGMGSFVQSLQRVNDRAFKLRTRWTGSQPVVQKAITSAVGGSVWMARRDTDLPIVRGKMKVSFIDQVTYSSQNGPAGAPEFGVDAGWLIQYADQAQFIADYYGARVTIPQPVLSSVALVPIPGLQLGDMVEVRDEHITRLTIRGVIVSDSRSIDSDMGMTHSVAVRPVFVTRNGVDWQTWGQVASQGGNGRWIDWGGRQSGKSWQGWGGNPLLGEAVI